MKRKILRVVLSVICLIVFFCLIVFWINSCEKANRHYGVKYYINEEFKKYQYGNEAYTYLPKYDDLSDAQYIDFIHENVKTGSNNYVVFAILSCYDDQTFSKEKEHFMSLGNDFGNYYTKNQHSIAFRLIKQEKTDSNQYMHYIAGFSEDDNCILFIVSYNDFKFNGISDFFFCTFFDNTALWEKLEDEKLIRVNTGD